MGKPARRGNQSNRPPIGRVIFALGLTACAAFLLASRVSFDPADPPTHLVWPASLPVRNVCGPAGAWIAYQLVKALGVASWLVVLALLPYAMRVRGGKGVAFGSLRLAGVVMLAGATA